MEIKLKNVQGKECWSFLQDMEDFHPKMMFVLLKAISNPLGQNEQESDHDHQQNHVPEIRLFRMIPNKKTHFHQNRCLSFCCGILVKLREGHFTVSCRPFQKNKDLF